MATTKTAIAGFWNNFFSQPPQLEVVAGCSGGKNLTIIKPLCLCTT